MRFSTLAKFFTFATMATLVVASAISTENTHTAAYNVLAVLEGRQQQDNWNLPPLCVPVPGQNWHSAPLGYILEGISYLDGHSAPCGAAPHTCARTSCSYNSAIYMCCDNDKECVTGCDWVAQGAKYLVDSCKVCYSDRNCFVGGQVFNQLGFNIIVRQDTC